MVMRSLKSSGFARQNLLNPNIPGGSQILSHEIFGHTTATKKSPLGCIFCMSNKRVLFKVCDRPNMVEEKSKADMSTNLDSNNVKEPLGRMSHNEKTDLSDDDDIDPNYKKESEDETSEEETPGEYAKATAARTTGTKRSGSHLDVTRKVAKRRKNQRNTSHASKLECIDVQEIKHCLENKGCSCGKKCLKKLCKHGARAVRSLEKLRLQRFQGNKFRDIQNAHHHFSPTPG